MIKNSFINASILILVLYNFAQSNPIQNEAIQISAGSNHSLALKKNGSVWAWGWNQYGQLGDNSTTNKNVPVRVFGLSHVMMLAAGHLHSLALKNDGTVWAWGKNSSGQIGDGTTTDYNSPVQVSLLNNTILIAAGYAHNLALKNDGTVWTWGNNLIKPVQVSELEQITSVSAGQSHNLALKVDGTVWAWGNNNSGQLGDGTITSKNSPVHVIGLNNIVLIASGFNHSMALRNDGTIWAWGNNRYGQLGDGTSRNKFIPVQVYGFDHAKYIAAGHSHSLAMKEDCTVLAWGNNNNGQLGCGIRTNTNKPIQIYRPSNVKMISAGYYHSIILKNDGSVWTFGDNRTGKLGDGKNTYKKIPIQVSGLNHVTMVAAGAYHSLALKDSFIWSWGYNDDGQLGDGTNRNKSIPIQLSGLKNVKLMVTKSSHCMVLNDDNTIWAWGQNYHGELGDKTIADKNTPVQIPGLTEINKLSVGYYHSFALNSDGNAWAWGNNESGQLGNNTTLSTNIPKQIIGFENYKLLAAGHSYSLGLKEDGTVWAWGNNCFGQLGDGTMIDKTYPVKVYRLDNVTEIDAGNSHSIALKNDGSVWVWGSNGNGQLGIGTYQYLEKCKPVQVPGLDNIIQVAAGSSHCLALKVDGTVWAWGWNQYGQLGDGKLTEKNKPVQLSGLDHITMLAAGYYFSLALKNDGTIWGWGDNQHGQLGYGYPTYMPEPVFSEIQFRTKTFVTTQNATITIPIINKSQKNINFFYTTQDATAVAGIDYIHTSGELTFQDNETQKNIHVTILNNPDNHSEKNFSLNLGSSEDFFFNDATQAIITISSLTSVHSPYSQTFSYNMPACGWAYYSSMSTGRIQVTSGHLRMDNTNENISNLNEAILNINLSFFEKIKLNFFQIGIAFDTCISLPEQFTDHYEADGISISIDGYTWYRIIGTEKLYTENIGKEYSIDIDNEIERIQRKYDPNFRVTSNTQIKFQQYGNRSYPSGGREWDNITITGFINHPPEFTVPLPDKLTINEDRIAQLIIQINDPDSDYISLKCHSLNNTLLPDNQLRFSNNILSIQPAQNEHGSSVISVSISDGSYTITKQINLIVKPVNDPPIFTKGPNIRVDEDNTSQTVSWTNHMSTGPINESNQHILFIIESMDNPSILSGKPEISSNGLLTYTPAENAFGQTQVSVYAQDDGGILNNGNNRSPSQQFTIYIASVNDCPTFIKGNNLTVENRKGKQTITKWATQMNPGLYEDNQTIQFSLFTNRTDLFLEQPIIYPNGTLEFTPNPNETGIADITVSIQDNGGIDKNGCDTSIQQIFSIAVDPTYYTLCLDMKGQGSIQLKSKNSNQTVLPEWCDQFAADTEIRLEAIPEDNWTFASWVKDVNSIEQIIQPVMNKNLTIQVNFKKRQVMLILESEKPIKVNGDVITSFPYTSTYDYNRNILLEIDDPEDFLGWAGDVHSYSRFVSIQLSEKTTIAALYANSLEWRSSIKGISEADGNTCKSELFIGTSIIERTQSEDELLIYSCSLFIYKPESNDKKSVYIQKNNQRLYQWIIRVNPHDSTSIPGDNTVVLQWDPSQFSDIGQYYLLDGHKLTGDIVISDMKKRRNINISGNDTTHSFSIIWALDQVAIQINLKAGWNLASLPFQSDFSLSGLFSEIQAAYVFSNDSYIQADIITPCKGYWIKIPSDKSYTLIAEPMNAYTKTLSKGWHMVGSSITQAAPITEPESCIQAIFAYKDGAYQQVIHLEPGMGYWVKISEECVVNVGENKH